MAAAGDRVAQERPGYLLSTTNAPVVTARDQSRRATSANFCPSIISNNTIYLIEIALGVRGQSYSARVPPV